MDQDELLFRLNQLELGLKKQDERSHQQFVLILNRQDAFAQKVDQFRDNVKQKLGALNAKNDSVEKSLSAKIDGVEKFLDERIHTIFDADYWTYGDSWFRRLGYSCQAFVELRGPSGYRESFFE